jgi:hypothetical protein
VAYIIQIKLKTIKYVFVASALSTHHQGIRAKTGWIGFRIMCPSGATCLTAEGELALLKSKYAD